jgi:hypothetical protein
MAERDIEALERKVVELALQWRAQVPLDQWRKWRSHGMPVDELKDAVDALARAKAERPAPDHAFQVPHSSQDRCVEAVPGEPGSSGFGKFHACARPAAEHPASDPV